MKIFLRNILIFIIFPIVVLLLTVILYVVADPYMDFGKKQNYSWKYFFQQLGDVSTKKLINSSENYNSFIFGSSSPTTIYACYLNKVVPNSSFFHYGNWNETIGGIYNKLELIDSLGYEIDNVIIYLDTDFSFKGEGKCRSSDHYLITGGEKFEYLKTHFNSFYRNISVDKIKILCGCKVSGMIFPNWPSDLITNDPHSCNGSEVLLKYSKVNESKKLKKKIDSLKVTGFFYERPLYQEYTEEQISESEKEILSKIKHKFEKHHTNYYIVITPLYDQLKFSRRDQEKINALFGNRVFDFSGINNYTNNEYNYPDREHFQTYISKCIIDSIVGH